MASGPTQKQIFDALEAQYGQRVADAFEAAIEDLKTAAELRRAAEAIAGSDFAALLDALHMDAAAFGPLLDQIDAAYQASGEAATAFLPKRDAEGAKLVFRFHVRNQRAEAWLRAHSSALVTRILDDQREAIRAALTAGLARGDNPTATALDIVGRMDKTSGRRVGGIIGLTRPQAGYVETARAELASADPADLANYLGRTLRDRRFDRSIMRAIDTGEPIPAEIQAKAIVGYERKMLKLRGDMIGRTESLTALRAAKHEAFLQAVDSGQIDASAITRTWRSAGDARVRHTHQALNGQKARGLDSVFRSPSGALMRYPGDASLGAGPEEIVNCRCDTSYAIDFLAWLS